MNEAVVEAELDKSSITVFRRLGCNLGKVKKKLEKWIAADGRPKVAIFENVLIVFLRLVFDNKIVIL